ncbi:MAG: histidine phosphatase family protein [Gammaproteobacteria bacterium]|nr:histidine phosphatase family protein [Gammaproteobacteria bacterium]
MTGGAPESGFFFIRHGQTVANRDGVRSGGESDTHLTVLGREQARTAGLTLHRLGAAPSLILTSPLSRTIDTAEILNERFGLEIRTVSGLTERRLGAWNGRSIEATQPLLAAGETPPGGETNAVFKARVLAAFRGLAPHYASWPLIVSSRGVARILLEHAGLVDATSLPNGAILRATLANSDGDGDFVVSGIDHLEAPSDTA